MLQLRGLNDIMSTCILKIITNVAEVKHTVEIMCPSFV